MKFRVSSFVFALSLVALSGEGLLHRAAQAQSSDTEKVDPADPEVAAAVRARCQAFAEAQNARDPKRIGAFFIDGPQFLWVSDGQSFWGREDVVNRMMRFQTAEVWRVEPDLDAAKVIQTGPETAILHMPLTLVLGNEAGPARLGFLVSLIFVRAEQDLRIAAMLTTREKRRG